MATEQPTTNVVSLSTHRRQVEDAKPPRPIANANTILVGALLMAIREEKPEFQNRRWLAVCHHAGRIAGCAPDDDRAAAQALAVLQRINDDAHLRHDRGID